jgi:hypothetical protein
VLNNARNAIIAQDNLAIVAGRGIRIRGIAVDFASVDFKTPVICGAFCGKELAGNYWPGVHGGGQGVLLSAKNKLISSLADDGHSLHYILIVSLHLVIHLESRESMH